MRAYSLRWLGMMFIAVVFAAAGSAKLMGDPVFSHWFRDWGYPRSLMLALGVVEIVCGVLLALPAASGYAALALLGVALGAATVHLGHGQVAAALLPILLAVVASFVAWTPPGERILRPVRGPVLSPGLARVASRRA